MKNFWDEEYSKEAYLFGTEPDEYFRKILSLLAPGKLLLPGEGEGRNAVHAAKSGWQVTAYDYSEAAKIKAERLARLNQVEINYMTQDIVAADFPAGAFDVVALLFVHFEGQQRRNLHQKLDNHLKPGGIVIIEVFSAEHAQCNTHLGNSEKPFYTKEDILNDFPGYAIMELKIEREYLKEGETEMGDSSILRFVGRKQYVEN